MMTNLAGAISLLVQFNFVSLKENYRLYDKYVLNLENGFLL